MCVCVSAVMTWGQYLQSPSQVQSCLLQPPADLHHLLPADLIWLLYSPLTLTCLASVSNHKASLQRRLIWRGQGLRYLQQLTWGLVTKALRAARQSLRESGRNKLLAGPHPFMKPSDHKNNTDIHKKRRGIWRYVNNYM